MKRIILNRVTITYALPLIIFLALWHFLTPPDSGPYDAYPRQIFNSFVTLAGDGTLQKDLLESLKRIAVGFFAAFVMGWPVGVAAGRLPMVAQLIRPLLETIRPIPPIAWIPIAILWLGIGLTSAGLIIFLGAFSPIFSNVYSAAKSIPSSYVLGAKSLGASRVQVLKEIILPAVLPALLLGVKVGLGIAWMCVLAAEMIAAEAGLGYAIQINRQLLLTSNIMAYMTVIAIVGGLSQLLVVAIEFVLVPWNRPRSRFDSLMSEAQKDCFHSKKVIDANPLHGFKVKENPQKLFACSDKLELKDIDHRYTVNGSQWIFNKFTLKVGNQERVGIVGPSGCGKTTLVSLAAGFFGPSDGGIVMLDGRDRQISDGTRAVVFQDYSLFPWKTVAENIGFGLHARCHTP